MQEVRDIVATYCRRHDLEVRQGKAGDNDPAPLLPFLIMDCAYSEFAREIVPLDMRHTLKQMRKAWLADYHTFNSRLFHCLDAEQTDFVIDLMDQYEEFIANETMFIRVAVMNMVKGCDFDDQKIIGSLMLCNVFSQVAQIVWGGDLPHSPSPEADLPGAGTDAHHLSPADEQHGAHCGEH